MKKIKNKLQQMIKNIKTFFINKLCVSLKKETNIINEEKISKFKKIKIIYYKILIILQMKESEEKNIIDVSLMTIALSGATGGAVIGSMVGGLVGGIIGSGVGTIITGYAEFESRRERRKSWW